MVQTTARRAASGEDRAITILDVAREAEVSKSTVSRVLNGSPHVATVTRERVLDTVSRMDFRANAAARGLRTTRSFLVGLLVPAISNDVFSRIAEVLEEDLRHESVGLVIVSSGWDAGGERVALESLRDRRVDALVVSLVNDRDAELAQLLAAVASPIVLLDREIPGASADVVLTDQRGGIRKALEHLAGLGHRSIGMATLSSDVRPGRQAVAAFESFVAQLGLSAVAEMSVPYNRMTRHYGAEIAERMLATGATAMLCCVPNTVTAGVLEYLDREGISIPEDLSIVAMDESELASVKKPQLTVITRQIDDLARFASRMVTSRLANPDLSPRVKVVSTTLQLRSSTAPPAVRPASRQ
jgi:LacI family transcriptional regulator, galactose operon repressor